MAKLVKTRRIQQIGKSFAKIKRKPLLFVFFLFTISFTYPQKKELKMLEKAYKQQSTEKLKKFFDNWSREITPITDEELLTYNDTIKEAYKIFIDVYKHDGSNDFLITQNTLIVRFTEKITCTEQDIIEMLSRFLEPDSITSERIEFYFLNLLSFDNCRTGKETLTHTITNFRPAFHSNGKTILFLTEKYEKILKEFIGIKKYGLIAIEKEENKLVDVGYREDAISIKERVKRQAFLEHNNYIKIYRYPTMMAGVERWTLLPLSSFSIILFDKNMEYAIIWSTGIGSGQELVYRKKGETWICVGSRGYWIH